MARALFTNYQQHGMQYIKSSTRRRATSRPGCWLGCLFFFRQTRRHTCVRRSPLLAARLLPSVHLFVAPFSFLPPKNSRTRGSRPCRSARPPATPRPASPSFGRCPPRARGRPFWRPRATGKARAGAARLPCTWLASKGTRRASGRSWARCGTARGMYYIYIYIYIIICYYYLLLLVIHVNIVGFQRTAGLFIGGY